MKDIAARERLVDLEEDLKFKICSLKRDIEILCELCRLNSVYVLKCNACGHETLQLRQSDNHGIEYYLCIVCAGLSTCGQECVCKPYKPVK